MLRWVSISPYKVNGMLVCWSWLSTITLLYKKSKALPCLFFRDMTLSAGVLIAQLNSLPNQPLGSYMVSIHIKIPHGLSNGSEKSIRCRKSSYSSGNYAIMPSLYGVPSSEDASILTLPSPVCLTDVESAEHLFKDCMVASQVWEIAHTHSWFLRLYPCLGVRVFTNCMNKVRQSQIGV